MVYPFSSIEDFKVELTQDHELLRGVIREFSEEVLAKRVERGEAERDLPREVKEKAKEVGLYGLNIPPELGGQGGDYLSLLVASEVISRVWPSFGTFLLIDWMFMYAVTRFASEELKKKFVPPVARGKKWRRLPLLSPQLAQT
jgi:alkylation response protein AidB-like acyl-CoA dehydrogenase